MLIAGLSIWTSLLPGSGLYLQWALVGAVLVSVAYAVLPRPLTRPPLRRTPVSDRPDTRVRHLWRGPFTDPELTGLHARAFGHAPDATGWWARVGAHSLGWVCARRGTALVGFVNVAWDGGAHAFLLDTAVEPDLQRSGVGTGLVAAAVEGARAARCQWLHVDFEPHLSDFYLGACGMRPTSAGLLAL